MKRAIALMLTLALLSMPLAAAQADEYIPTQADVPAFTGLNDPRLLPWLEDSVYAGLTEQFGSEDYLVEDVRAIYYSKEYLEEMEYNSRSNIFFGSTLKELNAQFEGESYVFTLSDDGKTIVKTFEDYDDTYEQVIKNVAIGTGIILISVAVTVFTGGAATPVGMVFAASAKTGTIMALSGGTISAASAGAVKAIETKDFDEAMKAAALESSQGFKMGAIVGSISGGLSKLNAFRITKKNLGRAVEYKKGSIEINENLPQWQKSELRVLNQEGGYYQLSFQDGKVVPYSTSKATRPDVVLNKLDHLEALEVKNYDLSNNNNVAGMLKELSREVLDRNKNLPSGSTQRIILDVTDRNFSEETIQNVVNLIHNNLADIYPNIPVDILNLAA